MKNNYKNWYLYKLLASSIHKLIVGLNPKAEMRRVYYKTYHRYPDLENPKNLIEKIYWMQLHTDTAMWSKCADKYAMRSYIRECGFEDFLPKLLGKWGKAADIDLTEIDKSCILKTNNGCAQCLIINNPQSVDIIAIRQKFKRWLKVPYGYAGGQLHYTRIKPCVIAEELLESSEEDRKISPNSLIDYKVWCFSGKPECIWVAYNRRDGMFVDMALYNLNWDPIPQFLNNTSTDVYRPEIVIPKPHCLDEMLNIASRISNPFPEVRVDFYIINNRPIIGELTFTTGYGYFTDEYYDYLGSKLDVKNIPVIK